MTHVRDTAEHILHNAFLIAVGVVVMPLYLLWRMCTWIACRVMHQEHSWEYQRRMRPGLQDRFSYDEPMQCSRCHTKKVSEWE